MRAARFWLVVSLFVLFVAAARNRENKVERRAPPKNKRQFRRKTRYEKVAERNKRKDRGRREGQAAFVLFYSVHWGSQTHEASGLNSLPQA
ncbi:hypothetical protein V8C26DRAFT_243891 [Trichoderma gracile]